jgi:hypothetical protein
MFSLPKSFNVLDNLDRRNVLDQLDKPNVLDEFDSFNDLNHYNFIIVDDMDTQTDAPYVPICFIAGSNVVTDQGIVEIQNINTSIHTIRKMKIVALTKTQLYDNYLVEINKSALYKNVPNKHTIISPNHKVFYLGNMICAKDLIGKIDGVNKTSYNNEILYNILLEKHDKMIVNNLITETLDPTNIIANLYEANLSKSEKNTFIKQLNNAIVQNNLYDYINLRDNIKLKNKKTAKPM